MIYQVYQASSKVALIIIEIENLLPLMHKLIMKKIDCIIECLFRRVFIIVDISPLELRCILESLINNFPIEMRIQLINSHLILLSIGLDLHLLIYMIIVLCVLVLFIIIPLIIFLFEKILNHAEIIGRSYSLSSQSSNLGKTVLHWVENVLSDFLRNCEIFVLMSFRVPSEIRLAE